MIGKLSNAIDRDFELVITLGFAWLLLLGVLLSGIPFVTYCEAVVALLYLAYLAWAKPRLIIKYFAYVVFIGMNLAGAFVVETNELYLYELVTTTGFAGSFPLLAFSRCLFLMVIQLCEHFNTDGAIAGRAVKDGRKDLGSVFRVIDFIAVLVVLATAACLVDAMRSGSALGQGMTRFAYERLYGNRPTSIIADNLDVLIIFPLFSLKSGRKGLGVTGIVLYVAYMLWVGNKFGALLTFFALALLVFYNVINGYSIEKLRRVLGAGAMILLVLVCFAVAFQSFIWNKDAAEYLETRLAEQGQLWWRTYDLSKGRTHYDELDQELLGQFFAAGEPSGNIRAKHGIYKVMYYCAPEKTIDNKLATNAAYSEAGYAAMYYYFGPMGPVLFSICTAVVVYCIHTALVGAIVEERLSEAVLQARLTVLARSGLTMFTFTNFFNVTSILSYVWLLQRYLMRKRSLRRLKE